MTIASTQSKAVYGGNGSTATFAVPFLFLRDEDIEVVLTDTEGLETGLVISTDYTLSGAGEPAGGICTLSTPPEPGQVLVIRRNPAMVQEVDYVENDAFPAQTHEAALDKLTMICQALAERLDRTITFRVSSAVTGVELPKPESGRFLGWNEAGDDLTNRDLADIDGVALPLAVDQGGTGADTPAAALSNLGFGTVGASLAAADDSAAAQAAMDAEPADTAILKTDLPDLLRTVYGDEPQTYTGADLSTLTVSRNHILWSLTGASTFSDVTLPYDGTYIFHVYPGGHDLAIATSYKNVGTLETPDPAAGEVHIAVEQFNGRKTIVSLMNMEA